MPPVNRNEPRRANSSDSGFGLVKNAIRGVRVSDKCLQSYLNEYAWRYNRRVDRNTMFRHLLNEAASRPGL